MWAYSRKLETGFILKLLVLTLFVPNFIFLTQLLHSELHLQSNAVFSIFASTFPVIYVYYIVIASSLIISPFIYMYNYCLFSTTFVDWRNKVYSVLTMIAKGMSMSTCRSIQKQMLQGNIFPWHAHGYHFQHVYGFWQLV